MDEETRFTEEQLSPEERAMFQAMRREAEPSDALEERVVDALQTHGLLYHARWRYVNTSRGGCYRSPRSGLVSGIQL